MMVKAILFISLLGGVVSEAITQDRAKIHSFRFREVELRTALDSLLRWYEVPLIYLEKDVIGKRISAECNNCGFEEALTAVIKGQGLLSKRVGLQVVLQKIETKPPIATFAGTIRDSLTGEAVGGADVLLLNQQDPSKVYRWGSTNQFGFFSLRNIRPGVYVLIVRRLGYRPLNDSIKIHPGSTVRTIAMVEQELVHPVVTIEGRRSAFSALEGISRGVYIRATPSDHNQYLLEGARIYNPLHFGGVMSSFSGDALRDVQVIAGGVPPYYGGRIGGILDVALRDGAEKELAGSAAVGSLSSNLLLEGPAFKGTTFMLSGRRGYPDIFLPRYRTNETPSDLNTAEVMAKITRHLSRDQRLSLSAYFGRDTYGNRIADGRGTQLSNSLRWGNAAANLRWTGVISPSLFFYASAIYTRYGFDVNHRLEGIGGLQKSASNYFIEDAALRAHAEYFYDEYHTVLAGVELVRHRKGGRISEFSTQIAPMSFDGVSPWELAVYFQDQWRLSPSVLAEVGARATSFIAKEGSFSAVDPRFSLLVSLRDDLRFLSSLSAVNQFVHPYRNSGIFLFYPSIFLYPSTEKNPPSPSLQVSLGMEKNLQEDRYRIAVESYYRMTQKLHEFVFDTTMAGLLSDALILGEGNVYGIEVTVDKRLGDITGSMRYGLSWASNRFAELNSGEPFSPRFDRRHELYAMLSYSPHENWSLGLTCLLSANPFPSVAPRSLGMVPFTLGETAARAYVQYAEPYDLNGGRLPGFQRLEVRAMHRFSLWGRSFHGTLRLLNGYGLVDPFVWELRQNLDDRLKWSVVLDAPSLFPLYPVVSVGVRF